MIKSKIDARERALELAVKCFDAQSRFGASNVIGFAKAFEQYLIGDSELPEVIDESAHIRDLLDFTKKEMEKINKQNNFNIDEFVKKYRIGEYGMTGNTPCKSDVEYRMSSDKVNWKQARVDAAIGAMQGIITNLEMVAAMLQSPNPKGFEYQVARKSVSFADALIAELKKKGE